MKIPFMMSQTSITQLCWDPTWNK